MSRRAIDGLVVLAILAFNAGPARAQILDPGDFQSLGAFPTAPGFYSIDTGGTPTLTGPGGTKITGAVYSDAPNHSIAVFTFDSINVVDAMSIFAGGSRPLALLSEHSFSMSGTGFIDASGAGGFGPDSGPGAGSASYFLGTSGGGGGFGGRGGDGAPPAFGDLGGPGGPRYSPVQPNTPLQPTLLGGSGGGSAGGTAVGGRGGGAIEIVTVGDLTTGGNGIYANGGLGGQGAPQFFGLGGGGGGGSGGLIVLDGETLHFPNGSFTIAEGGRGGDGGLGGGGGAGGWVFALSRSGVIDGVFAPDVTGGLGGRSFQGSSDGQPGGQGVSATAIPEPASMVLLALGAVGSLSLFRRRPAA